MHCLAVAHLQLLQQRQRVMVIDEAHGFARVEGIEGAKNGRMAESLGNAACVKGIDGVGRGMDVVLGDGAAVFAKDSY